MTVQELDASLITVGKPVEGGACWVCFDEKPTYPTDAVAKMADLSYESVGELSTDGFTEGTNVTSTDFEGWHGKTLLSEIDKQTDTFKTQLLEVARATAAKVRYGKENVVEDPATGAYKEITKGKINKDIVSLVFDELESNGCLSRTVVKRCKITNLDDVPHKRGELEFYGMTFTVLDATDGTGEPVKTYRAKPATGATGPEQTASNYSYPSDSEQE